MIGRLAGWSLKRSGATAAGTVAGDVYGIGKNTLALLPKVRGFGVHDLGVDIAMSHFIERADELDADLTGMSALPTTTMPGQREVIELASGRSTS
jgi:dimethylamine corrinoid protein